MIKCLLLILPITLFAATFAPNTSYQVCFTPQDQCSKLLANRIYAAKKSIDVQAYSFTSYRIAHALKYAFQHGVKVRVILDKSNFEPGTYSRVKYLLKYHVPVWLDSTLRIAHNKVMVFDDSSVETGSFNYTSSAQYHNAENMLFIDSPALAKKYEKNFQLRLVRSKRLHKMVQVPKPLEYH